MVTVIDPVTGAVPLEARSGHKTLLKLLLENQATIIEHVDINTAEIHSLEVAIEHLIEQNQILIRHQEDITGEAYHPHDLTD